MKICIPLAKLEEYTRGFQNLPSLRNTGITYFLLYQDMMRKSVDANYIYCANWNRITPSINPGVESRSVVQSNTLLKLLVDLREARYFQRTTSWAWSTFCPGQADFAWEMLFFWAHAAILAMPGRCISSPSSSDYEVMACLVPPDKIESASLEVWHLKMEVSGTW